MTVLTWNPLLIVLAILDHPGPRSLGRLARVKLLPRGEQRLPPKIHTPPDHPRLHHDITTHIHTFARVDRLTEVVDRRVRPNARERRASRMSLVCNCVWIWAVSVVVAAHRQCAVRASRVVRAHDMRARVHARAFLRTMVGVARARSAMVGGVRCRIALARSGMVGGARCVHTTSTRARALR